MPRKRNTSAVQAAVGHGFDFEVSIADLARRSERRAWLVAWAALLMSMVAMAGYFYMLPLKEKVPYLVMADAYTGTSTVARLAEDFNNLSITSSEAINRANTASFVMARESYDVAMMNLRDWSLVYTMASPQVAAEYSAVHANNNQSSPYNTYGRSRAIRVRILSIVLLPAAPGAPPKGATVRFQRSLLDKTTGTSRALDSKIATLEFTYKPNLKMDEERRIANPLGFQVTSYRVDSDFAPAPALEGMPIPASMPLGVSALARPDAPSGGTASLEVPGVPQP